MISAKGSRPTRLRVASERFGGTPAGTIRRARSYASPFAGSFEVAHALAREGRRFENPLALDERYDLVVVSVYEFRGFRLDPQQRLQLSASEERPVALSPKVFDTPGATLGSHRFSGRESLDRFQRLRDVVRG